ncbi:MAG TPA: alpha/beta hydrolase [Caulobacteraceae bacterium]|jgi:pimeloyl-ACP methyl ester carboxylesterase|nr:alpha/beta hydrolase [Caulobacteraceae bacterium]
MEKEILSVPVNGVTFHCEKIGSGPPLVLVPDGRNDCGPFERLAELLSDSFMVLTFDMRGGTRSRDPCPKPLTGETLSNDVIGIIDVFNVGPVFLYGCSSGGVTALTVGKTRPELVRRTLVHEASLLQDTPIPKTGFSYFAKCEEMAAIYSDVGSDEFFWGYGDYKKFLGLGQECRARIRKNYAYWVKYYRGSVDGVSFSEADLKSMPPTTFSVGSWSPSWLVYANLATAQRGNCPVSWLNGAHFPETTCPEDLANLIRQTFQA